MLVLSRRPGESLVIGADVRVKVVSTSGGQVRLAIDAPRHVAVHREEVFERIAEANREAAGLAGDGEIASPQTTSGGASTTASELEAGA